MTQRVLQETDLMTVSQAARLLGVSVSSLRAWAAAGLVPHVRTPGGHRRFRHEELDEWMAARGGHLPRAQPGEGAMVAGRTQARPVLARAMGGHRTRIVDDALVLLADGHHVSRRRESGRRARVDRQLAHLVDALEAGDLSSCLHDAEWQAFRHGAAGLPATQPIGEALALGRAVERALAHDGVAPDDLQVVRDAMDRIVAHAAAGLAWGARSREESRDGLAGAA
jgi:excisionase family DNA binding protein